MFLYSGAVIASKQIFPTEEISLIAELSAEQEREGEKLALELLNAAINSNDR